MTEYSTPRPRSRLIVAASETDANLLWATRFFAPDPFIFIEKGGRRHLVLSDLEVDRAREQAEVDQVIPQRRYVERLQAAGTAFPAMADIVMAALEDLRLASVLVPANFPAGLADRLRARGFRLTVADDPFWPEREIKTDEEIHHIGRSLRAAEAGMRAGLETLRRAEIGRNGVLRLEGRTLTSEILRSRINAAVMAHGCVPSHTIVAAGEQAVDPHHEGSGPIRAHGAIIIDIFPRSQTTGYFGDMTRTFVRGRASDALHRAYRAVARAQDLACRRIRPGANAYRIHQELLEHFRRQGFETGFRDGRMQGFFHGTGHGLGLDVHEAPGFGLRAQNRFRLNHVVTVEPGLYYPGLGGIRLEDVVRVTRTGCRNLVRFPKVLEV